MRRIIPALLVLLLTAACAAAGTRSAAPVRGTSEAERVVQAQLEAYNRRDIDAFAATYAPDVVLYTYPDRVMSRGVDALRREYGEFFRQAPALNARIENRIVQGRFVIDREIVTGMPGQTAPLTAVAIYEVRNGRIQNVWFIQ